MDGLSALQRLVASHAQSGSVHGILKGLTLGAEFAPGQPVHSMYEPLLVVVAQGAKNIVLADRVFQSCAGDYIVVPLDLPVTSYVTQASQDEPFLALALRINPETVTSLLLEGSPSFCDTDDTLSIRVSPAPADLLDAAVRLLRLLDRPSDIAIFEPMIEREIVWRLLCGGQGGLVRQIGLADSRLSRISNAARWIREHYAETIRIEDLAERAGMSLSSFHRHFRAATVMSPLQYQKQIRLQEARARLMARADDVARIGSSVGYDSASQFSREYARLFGASPSRDAALQREALSS